MYERLVDDIDSFLAASDQTLTDQLRELAARFAEAVATTNARLRKCQQLIDSGLRSEAIHLAEAAPPLLGVVALLDLSQREEWDEILLLYNLPLAEPLKLDAARLLNEAYNAEQPTRGLMARHRLLALYQAPLNQRLAVMRKLASMDPAPFWEDDIVLFEKARLGEMPALVKQAQEQRDVAALEAIQRELASVAWRVAPSPKLIGLVEAPLKAFRKQKARTQLAAIEERLSNAYSAMDVEAARAIRDEFEASFTAADLSPTDPLMARAQAALAWLQQEDDKQAKETQWRSDVWALEQRLDDPAGTLADLERAYYAVARHDRALSQNIYTRYVNRSHQFRTTSKRRFGLIIAGAAVLLVMAGVGVYFAQRALGRNRQVQALQALVDAENWAQATDYYDSLQAADPQLAQTSDVVRLKGTLDAAIAKERQQTEHFDRLLAQAEAAPPEPPMVAPLEEAKKLATTDAQRQRISLLESQRKLAAERLSTGREQAFLARSKQLDDDLTTLLSSPRLDDADASVDRDLTIFEQRLASLSNEATAVSSDAASLLRPLERQVQLAQQQRRSSADERVFLQSLAMPLATSDIAAVYCKRLGEYIKRFPASGRAEAFQQVIEERPFWEEAIDRETTFVQWRRRLWELPPDAAGQRLQDARKLFAATPDSDAAKPFLKEYSSFLAKAADRQAEDLPSKAVSLFEDTLVKNIYQIVARDRAGKLGAYYVVKEPANAKGLTLQFITNYSGDLKTEYFADDQVISRKRAPQWILADRLAPTLALLRASGHWDSPMADIAIAIHGDETMDPVLRLLLLDQVIDLGMRGSMPLANAWAPVRSYLQQTKAAKLGEANWMDPESEKGNEARDEAQRVLNQLPKIVDGPTAVADYQKKLMEQWPPSYQPVGVLLKQGKRGWTLARPSTLAAGPLFVRCKRGPSAGWVKVGAVDAEQRAELVESDAMLEGRIVFLMQAAEMNVAAK